MFKRGSSLGLFGRFGRSEDLRRLDAALRAVDVHPMVVREAVKLAALRLMAARAGGDPPPEAYPPAAALLGYCIVGEDAFAGANGEEATLAVEARIERAVEAGEGIDAELVLLAMTSGVVQPSVVARFGLEIG